MALILVATAGAANANTYATLAEANTYHTELRLHSETLWKAKTTDEKNRALAWATKLIDENFDFNGVPSYEDQALRWPRTNVYTIDGDEIDYETIPQFLKNATAEFAYFLLIEDRTEETNRDLKGFKYMKIGEMSMVVDPYTGKPVIPPSVVAMLSDYGRKKSMGKTLVRV